MKKFKLFIENILIYGFGGMIGKIIPLLMLPIITRLMPDSEYFGLSDLSNTIVQFGSALAVMGMYDASFRLFFEKEDVEFQKKVCSTALIYTLFTSITVFLLLVIFRKPMSQLIFSNKEYVNLVYLTAISVLIGGTNSIVMIPTRTQNKRAVYILLNLMTSIVSYSASISLLLAGYYIIALPLAGVLSAGLTELVFFLLNRKWFSYHKFDKKILMQLLAIGIPLLPNFLIYWIFNSCDRIMIAKILGNNFSGIYSIGSKLGHASQLIYTAFAGGWQYFAFSTMKEKDQVKSNSMVFEYLGVISFIAGMFVCVCSYWIFDILFEGEYVKGYIVSPYLFLAPLMQMLFQVAGNQFIVIKRTKPIILILSIGAVLNIILNFYMIPVLGIEGAAIATLAGYIVSDVICAFILVRMDLMVVGARFIIAVILAISYMMIWRLLLQNYIWMSLCAAGFITIIYLMLYKEDIFILIRGIKEK